MKKEWFFLIEGHGLFAPRQLRPCCQLCLHCVGSCKLNPGERSGSVHTHPWSHRVKGHPWLEVQDAPSLPLYKVWTKIDHQLVVYFPNFFIFMGGVILYWTSRFSVRSSHITQYFTSPASPSEIV